MTTNLSVKSGSGSGRAGRISCRKTAGRLPVEMPTAARWAALPAAGGGVEPVVDTGDDSDTCDDPRGNDDSRAGVGAAVGSPPRGGSAKSSNIICCWGDLRGIAQSRWGEIGLGFWRSGRAAERANRGG